MKKVLRKIGCFLWFLVSSPLYAFRGLREGWAESFTKSSRPLSVKGLLMYGRMNLGSYGTGMQVTCRGEVIWETDVVFVLCVPHAVKRMLVHTWDIRDGKLWIRVCINERLLKELEEELEEELEDVRIMQNIQALIPVCERAEKTQCETETK